MGRVTNRRTRANGEGSIFPYRNGFGAYAWVTKPDGRRTRKYVYGKTRDEVHDKWIKLQVAAQSGAVATTTGTLGAFLDYWLSEIIEPNRAPATFDNYERFVRLYIRPKRREAPTAGSRSRRQVGSAGGEDVSMLCAGQG